jgi:hypothetical protein
LIIGNGDVSLAEPQETADPDDNGLDPNTFPNFGLFTFILFMTPVLKWIYVNVMRE